MMFATRPSCGSRRAASKPMGGQARIRHYVGASPLEAIPALQATLATGRVGRAPDALERIGEPSGTRTRDSLLKRQVLYRLS